jgi:cation:H+ antiporter
MPSVWHSVLGFVLGALAVWWAGRALAERADVIADRTGLGKVLAGAVLLGVATSLPEIGTTVSAASAGAGSLAANNLLGGVAMQITVLAAVDGVALRGMALTRFSPRAGLLMHGVFLVLLLAVASAAVVGPDRVVAGRVSVWSLALAAIYGVTIYALQAYEGDPRWEPRGEVAQPPQSAVDMKDAMSARYAGSGLAQLCVGFGGYAAVVLAGGWLVATSGEALARQTGLGQTLVGATLVAVSTSLPEVSTTFSAVRFGAYSMAVSNILGTNALEVALLLPADLAYAEGSIFAVLDPSSVVLAALGMVLTLLFVWGVLERRDRTVASLGIDSLLVLGTYAAGMLIFAAST